MKKLLYSLLAVSIIFSACEEEEVAPSNTNNNGNSSIYTYVPDDNFEVYLIGLGLDNTLNDTVLTAAIDTVTILDVVNLGITDLTGIEDFSALTALYCYNNQLTSLDVSNNTALNSLDCYSNQLTSLDVGNNTALNYLYCQYNQLTSLDISGATALGLLDCGSNDITSLDVSQNTSLYVLFCFSNQLITLDLRNGNNTNMGDIDASDNVNLYCINVDDVQYSDNNWMGQISTSLSFDSQSFFSEDCGVK